MTSTESCCGGAAHAARRRRQFVGVVQSAGRSGVLALPAVLLALLPKCPLCWSAYGVVLSSAGLSAHRLAGWWSPLLLVGLLVALVALARQARAVADRRPFGLGLVGALATACGVGFELGWLTVAGSGAFVAALGCMAWLGAARSRRDPGDR
jgi:hypothetical protein